MSQSSNTGGAFTPSPAPDYVELERQVADLARGLREMEGKLKKQPAGRLEMSDYKAILNESLIPFLTTLTGLIGALVLLFRGYQPVTVMVKPESSEMKNPS